MRPSEDNAGRVHAALQAFGAPLDDLTPADLATAGTVFQIGVDPVRIDVLTDIDGLTFEDAWADRVETRFGGQFTAVLSRRALIANKRASGRLQDLADVERLGAVADAADAPDADADD